MIVDTPNFINSKYLIVDEKGWRLKEDAPEDLQKEFEAFMQMINEEE